MEKMKQLQECRDEEEASQEEMATRFEREKRESMFVCSSGSADVVCIYCMYLLRLFQVIWRNTPAKGERNAIRCHTNITISLKESVLEMPCFLPGTLKNKVVPRFVSACRHTITLTKTVFNRNLQKKWNLSLESFRNFTGDLSILQDVLKTRHLTCFAI